MLAVAGVLASFVLLPAADVLLGRDLTPETEVPPSSQYQWIAPCLRRKGGMP